MKIKTDEDFDKTIKSELLAQTRDRLTQKKKGISKFMLKSYLNILLKGGKIRDKCFMYAVGKTEIDNAYCSQPDSPLVDGKERIDIGDAIDFKKPLLIKLFNRLKKDKKWITETTGIQEYNEDGREIHNFDEDPIISKRVTITIKTEYFIDDSLDIEEYNPNKV